MPGSGGGQGQREEVTQDQRLELITVEDALGDLQCGLPTPVTAQLGNLSANPFSFYFTSKKSINIFLPLANSYANREKLQVIRSCCSPSSFTSSLCFTDTKT